MKTGRPSDFTPELALNICTRMAEGESLREICREEAMPSRTTVCAWLLKGEAGKAGDEDYVCFLNQYTRACAERADNMFDEIEEIADDGSNDYLERTGKDGKPYKALNTEHVQRSRLRVDTKKWILSKMIPKKYGDRIQQDHTVTKNPLTDMIKNIQDAAIKKVEDE